jgi:hypothetical protein
MGGVFSRAEWASQIGGLAGAFAFHAVSMGLGAFLVGTTARVKQPAEA